MQILGSTDRGAEDFNAAQSAKPKRAKKPFIRPSKDFQPLQSEQMSLFPCADLFPQ
jgi:hypothetical protein